MIVSHRLHSHQLRLPHFTRAEEVVAWFGAMQAQEISMSKWAIAMRLKDPSLSAVEKAAEQGLIFRTHLMRPTWHWVAAEDIRWMTELTGPRVRKVLLSWAKGQGGNETQCVKACKLFEKILTGRERSRAEIIRELKKHHFPHAEESIVWLLEYAETVGLLCSGAVKGREHTYALLEERVPPCVKRTQEEALATLAAKYFRGHGWASVEDFGWWSGLTRTQARTGIALIKEKLETLRVAETELYSFPRTEEEAATSVHLLPAFDEYIIGYKDRSACLNPKHYSHAFNRNGIFYPVIAINGQIMGNWKKQRVHGENKIETSFFVKRPTGMTDCLRQAQMRYLNFLEK